VGGRIVKAPYLEGRIRWPRNWETFPIRDFLLCTDGNLLDFCDSVCTTYIARNNAERVVHIDFKFCIGGHGIDIG
jgi:hypothetical protein